MAKAAAASRQLSATMAAEALAPFSNISEQQLYSGALSGPGASALATGALVLLHQELGSTKRTRNAAHDLHWDDVTPGQKRKLAGEIEAAAASIPWSSYGQP